MFVEKLVLHALLAVKLSTPRLQRKARHYVYRLIMVTALLERAAVWYAKSLFYRTRTNRAVPGVQPPASPHLIALTLYY